MQLIKNLGRRKSKTDKKSPYYLGLFHCPYCKKEVKKRMHNGKNYKSCGCQQYIKKNFRGENAAYYKHGETKTRLYRVWIDMKTRCLNINNQSYKNYGKRGIKICKEWKNNYIVFRNWALANGYQNDLTIDRINNDGNYEPNNCRFVRHNINNQNKQTTKLNIKLVQEIRKKYKTSNYSMANLASKYNISQTMIWHIIHNKKWI